MSESTKRSYRVTSVLRMGGKEYEVGAPVLLDQDTYASLRDTGAIDPTPIGDGQTSGGASPAQASMAPTGGAGAEAVPDRGSEERASEPSGDRASEGDGAGTGEHAPSPDHARTKGGRKKKT